MHTFPLGRYMLSIDAGRWDEVANLMLESARKLALCGAELLVCPDNTAHQAMEMIVDRSTLRWLHIADEVAEVAAERGYRRIGLLGTSFLMEGPVYPAKLGSRDIGVELPDSEERLRINEIIFGELVYGRFRAEARVYFSDVIIRLKNAGCDAVALACTEIPLLVSENDSCLPVLDSTRILARAALREALSEP